MLLNHQNSGAANAQYIIEQCSITTILVQRSIFRELMLTEYGERGAICFDFPYTQYTLGLQEKIYYHYICLRSVEFRMELYSFTMNKFSLAT